MVRSCTAPVGKVIWVMTKPWSSSGRKPVGRRRNRKVMTATITRNATSGAK